MECMMGKKIKKILEVTVYEETRTVDLMDRYEGIGYDVMYQQLVLRNIACTNIAGNYEYISLIVERKKDHEYVGNITFTELKQGQTKDLSEFLRKHIIADQIKLHKIDGRAITFDTPYLFRAQNSGNRSGYGWGSGGTQYGETTAYAFVGAYVGYKSNGFTEAFNKEIEATDLSTFTIKNEADSLNKLNSVDSKRTSVMDEELELFPMEDTDGIEDDFLEIITEKRNTPDYTNKPTWYYAGFNFETNMFVLALEQTIYLPPIIDACENYMQKSEYMQENSEIQLTNLEKTFMFVEMLANSIGYSGNSVLTLDLIHKRKILSNILSQNIQACEYGEYGKNVISFHLIGDFLKNQPELNYRGFVELILSKYDDMNECRYELIGGFRDFANNEVSSYERQFWIGNDRYVLDEDTTGSYLQAIYDMAINK